MACQRQKNEAPAEGQTLEPANVATFLGTQLVSLARPVCVNMLPENLGCISYACLYLRQQWLNFCSLQMPSHDKAGPSDQCYFI